MKALVFSLKEDLDTIVSGDTRAVALAFEAAGYDVNYTSLPLLREQVDSFPFEDYDVICYQIPGSALFVSNEKNYKFFTEMARRAKDGALCLFQCDITYPLDPHIWNPKVGRAETKVNYLGDRPVKVIGSFAESVLDDPAAMKLMDSKYMRKLHPDSQFIPVEWLTFHYELMVEKRGGDESNLQPRLTELEPADSTKLPINRFYYGLKKTKLAKRLLELGFGSDPTDAVFGNIEDLLPEVRSLRESKRKTSREFWLPYAREAKEILIPYEPIKGDHQVTLRLLEALEFYPETASMDPKIADWMKPLVTDHRAWKELQSNAASRLSGIHKS